MPKEDDPGSNAVIFHSAANAPTISGRDSAPKTQRTGRKPAENSYTHKDSQTQ